MSFSDAAQTELKLAEIPKHLAHKQGCYVEEIKDVIQFHTSTAPVAICKKISCLKETLTYETCDPIGTDDPLCFITDIDYSRPYPQCCPTIECDIGISQ
ncbi:single domain von willebrand factor type C domain-containing protein [Phthorimaea operculella]|nr:single domain von willebrand factor type C domain-containing protein [Phthorimaea operculella]